MASLKAEKIQQAAHRETVEEALTQLLAERGQVQPGYFADLVVFDPETVADSATFERPTERAAGIHSVYVNGAPVWLDQAFTGEHAGRVLNRSAA